MVQCCGFGAGGGKWLQVRIAGLQGGEEEEGSGGSFVLQDEPFFGKRTLCTLQLS